MDTPKRWTKESMQSLLDSNDRAVERALVVLYQLQTSEEQAGHVTRESNGVGFSSVDADFGSSLAERVIGRTHLTPSQLTYGRRIARKYHRQLCEIANLNEEQKAGTLTQEESVYHGA